MPPNRSEVRSAILAASQGEGPRGESPGQYQRLMSEVTHILSDRGFEEGVKAGPPMGGHLEGITERRFREEVWDMIAAGILVPGKDSTNNEWPFLSLTEPGRDLVENEDPSPADPGGFVTTVDEIVPGEEQRVLLYLREAVGAFNRRLYVAATVMLGVAAEGLILRLADAIEGAFEDPEEGEDWYENNIEQMWALAQFRAVRDKVQDVEDDLPHDLREGFEAHWHSIHTLVRLERNESGHPTGIDRSRDEVQASLLLFPTLARLVRDFGNWAREKDEVF